MKERITKSIFWMVLSRGGVQAISLVTTLFIARLLSPEDYGLMALAGIWVFTISLLSEMGLGAAVIQFRDLDQRELNACFWLTLIIGVVGYGTLYAAAPAIASWFATPRLTDVLRVVGLALPLLSMRVVPDGLLRQRLALDRISQIEMAAALITIPVAVILAWSGAGVWTLVAAQLVQQMCQTLSMFYLVEWRPGVHIGSARLHKILRFSGTVTGTRLAWAAFKQADNVIIGKVCGDAILGTYSLAKQIAMLPIEKVAGAVAQISFPVMAELQDDRETMRRYFLKSIRLVSCLVLPLSIGILLVADDFVLLVLGEKWMTTVPILRVLCIYTFNSSLTFLLSPVNVACYRVDLDFRYMVAQALVMPLALWIGATWYGAIGAAVAWTAVHPLVLSWLITQSVKGLDLSWRHLFKEVRSACMATHVMAIAVIGVRWGFTFSNSSATVLRLLGCVTAGIVTYVLTLIWVARPVADEIFGLLRSLIGSKSTTPRTLAKGVGRTGPEEPGARAAEAGRGA